MALNPLGAVAYDEAHKAVDGQAATLTNIRTNAGTLLAAATIVTSFLGGQALGQPTVSGGRVTKTTIGALGWLAIVAFVSVAALTVAVLWPRQMKFDMEAGPILDSTAGQDVEEADGKAVLARYWDNNYDFNQAKLDRMFRLYTAACVLLGAEAICWILDFN